MRNRMAVVPPRGLEPPCRAGSRLSTDSVYHSATGVCSGRGGSRTLTSKQPVLSRSCLPIPPLARGGASGTRTPLHSLKGRHPAAGRMRRAGSRQRGSNSRPLPYRGSARPAVLCRPGAARETRTPARTFTRGPLFRLSYGGNVALRLIADSSSRSRMGESNPRFILEGDADWPLSECAERARGLEPRHAAWRAAALPLRDTRAVRTGRIELPLSRWRRDRLPLA